MIYERESHELRPSARPPLHHQLYNGDVRVSAPNVLSFTVICVRSMLQGFTFRLPSCTETDRIIMIYYSIFGMHPVARARARTSLALLLLQVKAILRPSLNAEDTASRCISTLIIIAVK